MSKAKKCTTNQVKRASLSPLGTMVRRVENDKGATPAFLKLGNALWKAEAKQRRAQHAFHQVRDREQNWRSANPAPANFPGQFASPKQMATATKAWKARKTAALGDVDAAYRATLVKCEAADARCKKLQVAAAAFKCRTLGDLYFKALLAMQGQNSLQLAMSVVGDLVNAPAVRS